jgi:hypothetical protein
MQLVALRRIPQHCHFRISVRRLPQLVQRAQMAGERGSDASLRDRRGIRGCVNTWQARNVRTERAVLFAFDYDWKILGHHAAPALRLVPVQAGVLQDAPLKPFAYILLGVDRNGDHFLRAWMDELPVTAFASALFDETGRLELPDQFGPCHCLRF